MNDIKTRYDTLRDCIANKIHSGWKIDPFQLIILPLLFFVAENY